MEKEGKREREIERNKEIKGELKKERDRKSVLVQAGYAEGRKLSYTSKM